MLILLVERVGYLHVVTLFLVPNRFLGQTKTNQREKKNNIHKISGRIKNAKSGSLNVRDTYLKHMQSKQFGLVCVKGVLW